MVGMIDNKNIFILLLKVIQTFSGVKKLLPVQRYLRNPVHNVTTMASLHILKVIWYIK